MFRKFFSAAISISIALSPASANSQEYIFRYRYPAFSQPAPQPESEYGVGNDVQVYFISAAGERFNRKIPVATNDVVRWELETGELPAGISVVSTEGVVTGASDAVGAVESLYLGYDSSGNRIARARIYFTVFEPKGPAQSVDYYTHTDTYFYQAIPAAAGLNVVYWKPDVNLPVPDGMKFGNLDFSGIPTKAGFYPLSWIGYDYMDRPIAHTYGQLQVDEGPIFSKQITSQERSIDLGQEFSGSVAIERQVGQVTYALIPLGDRPSGLKFSSSTGEISGIFEDYARSETFQIEARDAFTGKTSKSDVFTLTTKPRPGEAAELNFMAQTVTTRVGQPFKKSFSLIKPSLGDVVFTVDETTLPAGVSFENSTISSTSGVAIPGEYAITISATKGNDTVTRKQYIVVKPELKLSYDRVIKRQNDYVQIYPKLENRVGAVKFTKTAQFPSWLSLEEEIGLVHGRIPPGAPVGEIGPISVSVSDSLSTTPVEGHLTMNVSERDKLSLELNNVEYQRYTGNAWMNDGYLISAKSNVGDVTFEIVNDPLLEHLPPPLSLFGRSTIAYISGSTNLAAGTRIGPLRVKATDEGGPEYSSTSEPFFVTIVEPDALSGLNDNLNGSYDWGVGKGFSGFELPYLANSYGPLRYTVSDNNLNLQVIDGKLAGMASAPGTFVVDYQVKDDTPRQASTGKLTFKIAGAVTFDSSAELIEVNRGSVAEIVIPTRDGLAPFRFSVADVDGLRDQGMMNFDSQSGVLKGVPTKEGDYRLKYTVVDKAGNTDTKEIAVRVRPPLPFAAAFENTTAYLGKATSLVPKYSNKLGSVAWRVIDPSKWPPGLSMDLNSASATFGQIVGIPTKTGIYSGIELVVTDTVSNVEYPLTLTVTITKAGAVEFDDFKVKTRVSPSLHSLALQAGNVVGDVRFTLSDPETSDYFFLTPEGTLGYILDSPGTYTTKVIATDSLGRQGNGEITFEVYGDLRISGGPLIEGEQYENLSTNPITVENKAGEVSFKLADGSYPLPGDLKVNTKTGAIEGSVDISTVVNGVYIEAVDSFDGQASITGPITIAITPRKQIVIDDVVVNVKQFQSINHMLSVRHNVGKVTYRLSPFALPEGVTFDESSGAITGEMEKTFHGVYSVIATDEKGGARGTAVAKVTINVEPRTQLEIVSKGPITLRQHQAFEKVAMVDVVPGTSVDEVVYSIAPALPEGLIFDTKTASISGKSKFSVIDTKFTVYATDGKGGELGQSNADITVGVSPRLPLDLKGPTTFEFSQFFHSDIGLEVVNPIGTYSITVTPPLPADFHLENDVVSATPELQSPRQTYMFTVTDETGDKKSLEIAIAVGSRRSPIVSSQEMPLTAILNKSFEATFEASQTLGDVAWEVVDGTLPEGLVMSSSGKLTGTPNKFGPASGFSIRVIDTFNGIATPSQPFPVYVNVMQDGTPLTLIVPDAKGRIRKQLSLPSLKIGNIVGKPFITVSGLENTGLEMNPLTGAISGFPNFLGSKPISVMVRDVTSREVVTQFAISVVDDINLVMPSENDITFNYTFERIGAFQPQANGIVGTPMWAISDPSALPQGLYFDLSTGRFEGKPKELGAFGPFTISVADDLPGRATSEPIYLTVFMNDEPIQLYSQESIITKQGKPFASSRPLFDNTWGQYRFFSLDLAGTSLALDPITGILSGTCSEILDRNFNLSITDDTNRVTSKPVRIQVLPAMVLSAPSLVTINAQEAIPPIAVSRVNAVAPAKWLPVDAELLPSGITFNTATGVFEGYTDDLGEDTNGVFGPVVVSSLDAVGDRADTLPILIKVQPGAFYLKLTDAKLPDVEKRLGIFNFDLTSLTEVRGMDKSEVTYSFQPVVTGESLPGGLVLDPQTGKLTGTPTSSGDFNFRIMAKGNGKSYTARFAVKVTLPEISLKVSDTLPKGKVDTNYDQLVNLLVAEHKNIPLTSIVFSVDSTSKPTYSLPPGVFFSSGRLTGSPAKSGTYKFVVTAKFQSGADELIEDSKEVSLVIDPLLYRFDMVDAYDDTTCGVTTDKELVCAGRSGSSGSKPTLKTSLKVRTVAVGPDYQICWVREDGVTICGGSNDYGQIGNGTTSGGLSSNGTVSGVINPKKLAVGYNHACALLQDGGVKCWGSNAYGQIGNPAVPMTAAGKQLVPTYVPGLESNVSDIVAGQLSTCALTDTGSIKCWGRNINGDLGNGSSGDTASPTNVPGTFVSLGRGWNGFCGIVASGEAKCWGNGSWNLQYASSAGPVRLPKAMIQQNGRTYSDALKSIQGSRHGCVLRQTGSVDCWGYSDGGQNGYGSRTDTQYGNPVTYVSSRATFVNNAIQLVSGQNHTCALLSDRSLKCWGQNNAGQLGNYAPSSSSAFSNIAIPWGDK